MTNRSTIASAGRLILTNNRDLVLRTVPRPHDINSNGHIFGGWVLSQMDIAGGIMARRIAEGPVATVAIESMQFISPILMGDIISLYAHEIRRGRTSVTIHIEVEAARGIEEQVIAVTNGVFSFVALDENHRPRPLPVTGDQSSARTA
ncbi:acyl-CoA thioesterase [Sphingobium arseniciresistens]|uniref:acyl-CoA thioesterase n=1 Tax=Sphingobium arseniciresistens TaxID=3030834 RepID=UPI003BB18465